MKPTLHQYYTKTQLIRIVKFAYNIGLIFATRIAEYSLAKMDRSDSIWENELSEFFQFVHEFLDFNKGE